MARGTRVDARTSIDRTLAKIEQPEGYLFALWDTESLDAFDYEFEDGLPARKAGVVSAPLPSSPPGTFSVTPERMLRAPPKKGAEEMPTIRYGEFPGKGET